MKCPNCQAPIRENSLYCENCGEDIHIVPDFEAEVEKHIEMTLQEIVEDMSQAEIEHINMREYKRNKVKRMLVLLCSFVLLFLCMFICAITYINYQSSEDYKLEQANKYVDNHDYRNAILSYEDLIFNYPTISYKLALADLYFLNDEKQQYESLLLSLLEDESISEEDTLSIYEKLITMYRNERAFFKIQKLVMNANRDDLKNQYSEYFVYDPEFSTQSGYYMNVLPLKITDEQQGRIFYTINGDEPGDNDLEYTNPIVLDQGDYIIQAVFVNDFGMKSNVITGEYHITTTEISPPAISAVSGDYQFPSFIETIDDDQSHIYYTIDGTDPTEQSIQYTGPIPMPLGHSTFKFIKIENDISSEIIRRDFNLVLNTDYTIEEAVKDILLSCQKSGKIYDEYGHSYQVAGTYKYHFDYVTNINQIDDFYVFSEFIATDDGNEIPTNVRYAVNAYTKKVYELLYENYNYTLVELDY